MNDYALLAVLLALLLGLVAGKAWERYKLRDGRWIDRRRLRETPHYMLGLNSFTTNRFIKGSKNTITPRAPTPARPETRLLSENWDGRKGKAGRRTTCPERCSRRRTFPSA